MIGYVRYVLRLTAILFIAKFDSIFDGNFCNFDFAAKHDGLSLEYFDSYCSHNSKQHPSQKCLCHNYQLFEFSFSPKKCDCPPQKKIYKLNGFEWDFQVFWQASRACGRLMYEKSHFIFFLCHIIPHHRRVKACQCDF
jgi:hypothetical protein